MGLPFIEVKDLVKYFPLRKGFWGRRIEFVRAVDSVSFSIHSGETFGLVGESGCGKSTVGNLILGLLSPDKGKILYKGRDIKGQQDRKSKKVRRNIQVVFQDPQSSLDPRMLIKKTVGYPLEINKLAKGAEIIERVKILLAEVGLKEEHMYRYPHEFSGGQRQRISIARALSTAPEFVVFDEPTSSLDVSVQAQILNLIKELQQRNNYSYLFISHNLSVVKHISHRVAVMYLGLIVESAPKNILFDRPLHPYTQALLGSIPLPDPTRRQPFAVLEGDVPSPVNIPSGCRFHPRCPKRLEQCDRLSPPYKEVEEGHWVACLLC